MFQPFPRQQDLDSPKLKEFGDDNFQFNENDEKVPLMSRNHCGKRRDCLLQANAPFPTVVFKRLVLQTRKNQGLFGKGFKSISPRGNRKSGLLSKGLTLYQRTKILDWSKLKAFMVDIIKSAEMRIFVCSRIENIKGKGENADYQHFHLFPTKFSKGFFILGVVKSQDCMVLQGTTPSNVAASRFKYNT